MTDAATSLPQPEDTEAQHASLKYSLLGPSLTKAGQDSVDQSKVRIHLLTRSAAPRLQP